MVGFVSVCTSENLYNDLRFNTRLRNILPALQDKQATELPLPRIAHASLNEVVAVFGISNSRVV
jgi:hypothetical protein